MKKLIVLVVVTFTIVLVASPLCAEVTTSSVVGNGTAIDLELQEVFFVVSIFGQFNDDQILGNDIASGFIRIGNEFNLVGTGLPKGVAWPVCNTDDAWRWVLAIDRQGAGTQYQVGIGLENSGAEDDGIIRIMYGTGEVKDYELVSGESSLRCRDHFGGKGAP